MPRILVLEGSWEPTFTHERKREILNRGDPGHPERFRLYEYGTAPARLCGGGGALVVPARLERVAGAGELIAGRTHNTRETIE